MPLPAADALIPRAYRASAICPVTLPRGMLLIKRAYLSPFVLTAYDSLRSNAYAVLTAA